MAGGTWITQNKVRAGAYINFKAATQDSWNVDERNVMTMPVAMDWGPEDEIIELTADQLLNGSCEKIIGYTADDAESLVFRQALSNCYKALIYRLNGIGGAKASFTVYNTEGEEIGTLNAKHPGVAGNNIAVKVVENEADNTKLDVITYYRDNEKDRQTISKTSSIIKQMAQGLVMNNDWVDFDFKTEQCTGTIEGDNFTITCEARSTAFLGEEGNNLNIALSISDGVAHIIIRDDLLTLEDISVNVGEYFELEDLPESRYVMFIAPTGGTISKTQTSIEKTAFSQVNDPRITFEAGALLSGGKNGKSTKVVNAKAVWGGLQAESKLEAEEGNNLAFSIEADGPDESDDIKNDTQAIYVKNTCFKWKAATGAVALQNLYMDFTLGSKDSSISEENYVFNINGITEKKLISTVVWDTEPKLNNIYSLSEGAQMQIKFTGPSHNSSASGSIIVLLRGTGLIKHKTSGEVIDGLIFQKICEFEFSEGTKPSIQWQHVENDSVLAGVFPKLELNSAHYWDVDNCPNLTDTTKWKLVNEDTGEEIDSQYMIIKEINAEFYNRHLSFTIANGSEIGRWAVGSKAAIVCSDETIKSTGIKGDDGTTYALTDDIHACIVHMSEAYKHIGFVPYFINDILEVPLNTETKTVTVDLSLGNSTYYTFKQSVVERASNWMINSKLDSDVIIKSASFNNNVVTLTLEVTAGQMYENDEIEVLLINGEGVVDSRIETGTNFRHAITAKVMTVYKPEDPYSEDDLKIVINDMSSNGKTVSVIHFIKKDIPIEQLVLDESLYNEYIEFTGSGLMQKTITAVELTGGDSKKPIYAEEDGYFDHIRGERWNCMCLPQENLASSIKALAVQLIKDLRENQGIKCQLVLDNYAGTSCNYEGVISVKQGYKTADEEVPRHIFCAYVAGLTAGANFNKSNTYQVISGATDIIYYDSEKPYTNADYISKLKEGHFLLTKRRDLTIVCEKDQNTLHDPYPNTDVNYSFTKNRVIRTLDEINNTIVDIWENRFVGKVTNNAKGRTMYRTALINYIQELERLEAVQNFDPQKDVEVLPGEKIDAVVVNLAIAPTDAMEKLYMTININ